jgi:hypothetical protein
MPASPYRQFLPKLDLALERLTDKVPNDGAWYLTRSGTLLGRYRTRKEAMKAWQATLDAADWKPPKRVVDPRKTLLRESTERWSRNRAG